MAAVRGAAAPTEQVEPVAQALGQRGQPERRSAGGAELDGQRQPVQTAAQLGDERHSAVAIAAGDLGQRAGAGEEQPDRRARRVGSDRHGQRRQCPHRLLVEGEPLAAGDQQSQIRRLGEQLLRELGHRVEHVLGVVEHQQPPRRGERGAQRTDRVPAGNDLHAGRGRDRLGDPRRPHRHQIDPPRASDPPRRPRVPVPGRGGSCRPRPDR